MDEEFDYGYFEQLVRKGLDTEAPLMGANFDLLATKPSITAPAFQAPLAGAGR